MITPWFPTAENPISGIFIQEHARALAISHHVVLIHITGWSASPKTQVTRREDRGFDVVSLSYPKSAVPGGTMHNRLYAVKQLVHQIIEQDDRPDIIHANIYSTSDLAWYLGRLMQIPAVLSEHSSAFPRRMIRGSQSIKTKLFLNRLSLIMPVSAYLLGHMQKFGIKAPLKIVPNTVDTSLFFPKEQDQNKRLSPIRILFVGGLLKSKGVDLLIRAFSKLPPKRAELVIIGDGPERGALEGLTESLELKDNVNFLGGQPKTVVAETMRKSDLFVLPSMVETQGVVVLEAMASGLPVIASETGGIPEGVKPYCGKLVPPGDLEQLTIALEDITQNLERFDPKVISQYARDTYNYSVIASRFEECYQFALGGTNK